MKLNSEKEKQNRRFYKWFKRNQVKEAKLLLLDGTIISYTGRSNSLKLRGGK